VSLLDAPKSASTDGLDVLKGDVLVLVQVVEDLVVHCSEDAVVRGFDGSQNDGLKNIVDCERVHVFEGKADLVDFTKMGVDIFLGVAVPCHEACNLAIKKDSLHTVVVEREIGEKGFPYLLISQKLGRAVFVKNGEVV
jgi:hypothetical protein